VGSQQVELRCEHRILFGYLEDGVLEVKCRSERCGARPGVVVIHRFSTETGDLLETLRFRDPALKRKEA
jgi:hypothetical protein